MRRPIRPPNETQSSHKVYPELPLEQCAFCHIYKEKVRRKLEDITGNIDTIRPSVMILYRHLEKGYGGRITDLCEDIFQATLLTIYKSVAVWMYWQQERFYSGRGSLAMNPGLSSKRTVVKAISILISDLIRAFGHMRKNVS
jgi:hypothetical protein